jgi:flagellar motor switch protein FliN
MKDPERSRENEPAAERGLWLSRLEAELARELGQPVTLTAGGEPLEAAGSLNAALALPGARLTLAANAEEVAALLVAGRLVAAGQAEAGAVRELWSGILASVAARLEGRVEPVESAPGEDAEPESGAEPSAEPSPEPCTLRLGDASARVMLGVEKTEDASAAVRREPVGAASAEAARGHYDLLLEVELDAQVRFGSRELELKELLELGPGDVVELDRNVADPVDLIVGGRIVARGEVVLVDGNFGLRVTEVAEPVRRLESIRCMA